MLIHIFFWPHSHTKHGVSSMVARQRATRGKLGQFFEKRKERGEGSSGGWFWNHENLLNKLNYWNKNGGKKFPIQMRQKLSEGIFKLIGLWSERKTRVDKDDDDAKTLAHKYGLGDLFPNIWDCFLPSGCSNILGHKETEQSQNCLQVKMKVKQVIR